MRRSFDGLGFPRQRQSPGTAANSGGVVLASVGGHTHRTSSNLPQSGPASPDRDYLTPSVNSAIEGLSGEVTATEIAARLLGVHPEYAAGRGGEVVLDPSRGIRRATSTEWLDDVRGLLVGNDVRLHGRVVILGLARLDKSLQQQLDESGLSTALEAEIHEPLDELFRRDQLDINEVGSAGSPRLANAATADMPASEDLLGFAPLVSAVHAVLDDPATTLPLAIAVTGRWGAGKSSMMRQLEQQLRNGPENGTAHRRWTIVRFDAWKYERSERLWAALAKSVYEQALASRGTWHARLLFRVGLEWRRLGWWRFVLRYAWPVIVAAAVVVALLAADLTEAGKRASGLALLAAGLATFAHYWRTIADPFKRAIERHASRPDYEEHLGFTSDADRDIACLTAAVAPGDSDALAVFIDDLDRCSSGHLVEVVEAVNQIFNSDERVRAQRSVFVLGLDREAVAGSIEAAYGEMVDRLKAADSPVACDFGFHFIDKLVQLSIGVPHPRLDRLPRLLASERPSALLGHAQAVEALERVRQSEDVDAAEVAALVHLERNPRQAKRFHNVFRLQVYVAAAEGVEFDKDQLVTLARWVALRLRWPALADDLDYEPGLLGVLDAFANEDLAKPRNEWPAEAQRLAEVYARWFADGKVTGVLASSKAGVIHRVGSLPLDEFLVVA